MLTNERIQTLIKNLPDWPGTVKTSHKRAGQQFHKLTFVTDLGLSAHDSGIYTIVARILKHQPAEGPFQLPMNIPARYGGTGQDQWAWVLYDAQLIIYAMVKFGLRNEPEVKLAIEYLKGLLCDNGWPCAASKEVGNFRGPGPKDDPCPFANLAMLKVLSEFEESHDSQACQIDTNTLLSLWSDSTTRHPNFFYMGTDFRKLKVRFNWNDLLYVLDILSQFSWLMKDFRLLNMLRILKNKMDQQGRFTPESIRTARKDWEFGQEKEPSRWVTLLAWHIIRR
jgi:hypothetical protein